MSAPASQGPWERLSSVLPQTQADHSTYGSCVLELDCWVHVAAFHVHLSEGIFQANGNRVESGMQGLGLPKRPFS